jgi:hypothetical protein
MDRCPSNEQLQQFLAVFPGSVTVWIAELKDGRTGAAQRLWES